MLNIDIQSKELVEHKISGVSQHKGKVIIICDNTLGSWFCDIDDGLAILLLLGCSASTEVIGILTSFGNSDARTATKLTSRLVNDLNKKDIPIILSSESTNSCSKKAIDFLHHNIDKYPNQITLLCLSPLTALHHTINNSPGITSKIKKIVCMGGKRKKNWVGWRKLKELNFSLDPYAAKKILESSCEVILFDTDACLQLRLGKKEIKRILENLKKHPAWITRRIKFWYRINQLGYFVSSFCPWDLVAAAYLLNPDIFLTQPTTCTSTLEDMKSGNIKLDHAGNNTNLHLVTHIVDPGAIVHFLLNSLKVLSKHKMV